MKQIVIGLTLFLLLSCGGVKKNKENNRVLKIELPQPPSIMTDIADVGKYVVEHFWDKMDFADTAYIRKDVTEEAYATYLNVLRSVPRYAAEESVDAMMTKARADSSVYAYFAELSEYYLYDPNSPYRNEDLYIKVLENIIAWDKIDELHKLRPQSQLELAMKNREGELANDFRITLSSGATMRLYDIKADYTLVYFNNPDCFACAQVTAELQQSNIIQMLLQSNELKIVTVYPDEDLTAWRKHLANLPSEWINSYDASQVLRNNDLYDFRAIPMLYLLDRDKRVLLKDAAAAGQIDDFFSGIL